MAYAIQSAFGAGELTPELQERTTLEKYKTGLKTLRNAVVTKVGSIKSRPGTVFNQSTKRGSPIRARTITFDNTTDKGTSLTGWHSYTTNLAVTLTTTGTLPPELSVGITYYIIEDPSDPASFKLASTIYNSNTNFPINLSGNGSGTITITPADLSAKKCVVFHPPYTNYVIEFGPLYVRIHDVIAGDYADGAHLFDEDDLPYIQFAHSGDFLYVSSSNPTLSAGSNKAIRIVLPDLVSGDPDLATRVLYISSLVPYRPSTPFSSNTSLTAVGAPAGYDVEYVTCLKIGNEVLLKGNKVSGKISVAAAQSNTITGTYDLFSYQTDQAIEMLVFRRPKDGQGYGFIGSTDTYSDAAAPPYTTRTFTFRDFGQTADYTNLPPTFQTDFSIDTWFTSAGGNVKPAAIGIYQQRFIMSGSLDKNKEATFASRPGFPLNFLRDYPIDDDSALAMKAGTNGTGRVLRYADLGGLAAFTTQGIFMTPIGPLTPETAVMLRRANYVIDDIVPPLEIPGSIIFVDKSTNSVVALQYSDEQASFQGSEISIYSNHLFLDNRIVSWAFQDGVTPLVWCVMEDGTLVLLTYQNEQLVRAWSRGDTDGLFESVTVHKSNDGVYTPYFIVKRDDYRVMETLSNREQSDIKDFICMDSTVTFKEVLEATFTVTPVVPGDYEGILIITASSAVFSNSAGSGNVGTIFRWFHEDGHSIDLEVTTYTSTTVVRVQPNTEFPHSPTDLSFTELYKTTEGVTGLDHLEGKSVSVLLDGFVEASPYNFKDNHTTYVVSSGGITLEKRAAIVHVGLPYAVDIETLDVETVEQKPTLLESIVCNKVEVKVYKSRGFWVGQNFPDDDSNDGMEDSESETQEEGDVSLATKALAPYTKREEVIIEGSWESKGRIAIRQIDPLPLEISSIIPDIDVQYKTGG